MEYEQMKRIKVDANIMYCLQDCAYNKYMRFAIAIIISLLGIVNNQKAFILSSSVGYYNYRQNANALKIYSIIRKYGIQDEDIVLAFPQNVGCCEKNPLQGVVSFYDNDNENINKNIEVDLKFSMLNTSTVIDALRMKYPPWTLNINRQQINEQPYLVYLTGHGGDYYFKIRERQALVSQHFEHLFKDLSIRSPQSTIFVVIDSCSAITPFEKVDIDNFIAIGSSSLNQKSLSYGYDPLLNQPKSDQFTYYFGEFVKEMEQKNKQPSIKDLWDYMSPSKLKVHSKLVHKQKRSNRRKISQFFTKKMKANERRIMFELPPSLIK